jgi:hypothetical protein
MFTVKPMHVVCFLLGNSSGSEFYMLTFRNTLVHLHRQVGVRMTKFEICWGIHTGKGLARNIPTYLKPSHSYTYPAMKTEQTECSETSAYKIQTPGNYPEESIQHSEQGESLKSRNQCTLQYSVFLVIIKVTEGD